MAKECDGHRQPGSGNQPGLPGDLLCGKFLIECKITGKGSFQVSNSMILKARQEAMSYNKEWAIIVETEREKVVVIDLETFKALLGG